MKCVIVGEDVRMMRGCVQICLLTKVTIGERWFELLGMRVDICIGSNIG